MPAPDGFPIAYWSHSSLLAFLRNPLAWHTRYVERIYDAPRTPASIIGSAGHVALEHFYSGAEKELAMRLGAESMDAIADFEINFGAAKTKRAQRQKREAMKREYYQAVNYYLKRPPKHTVLGAEVKGVAEVPGLLLPVKAISDLVVESKGNPGAVDVVDHKFVQSFSTSGAERPAFALQAIFNYYTVKDIFDKPVKRFIVYECKKTRNADGRPQLKKYVLEYEKAEESFKIFHRLLMDATEEVARKRVYLPNPSDMFEGEHSFELYRLKLNE